MANIGLIKDEIFPVYDYRRSSEGDVRADVSEATLDRWYRVLSEYGDVQIEMQAYYEGWAVVK